MKIKYFFILVFLFAISCQNNPKETTEQTTVVEEEIVMANAQKIEISITGMTCTGCENAIQKTINEFDGVYSSKADHINGIAVLEIDSTKVDIIKIESAINDLGYEATGHTLLTE